MSLLYLRTNSTIHQSEEADVKSGCQLEPETFSAPSPAWHARLKISQRFFATVKFLQNKFLAAVNKLNTLLQVFSCVSN